MNKVNIIGTITRDCDLKHTQSGISICSFSIAINERWKDQSGEMQEKTHFVDCTAFGKKGEVVNQYFGKGSRIGISGSLSYESWTDQNGGKRSKLGVKVDDFDFIDKRNDNGRQSGYNQAPHQHTYKQPSPVMQENTIPKIEIDEYEVPF